MVLNILRGEAERASRYGRRLVRVGSRPGVERKAIALGQQLARSGGKLKIPREQGWARFDINELAGASEVFSRLRLRTSDWCADEARRKIGKSLPIQLLRSDDLIDTPELFDIAFHPEILAAVGAYLGQAPQLISLAVWWSPVVDRLTGSQLYHYDHRDQLQAKLFVNLQDVDGDTGPLHFIGRAESERFNRRRGYTQSKISDDVIYSVINKDEVHTNEGPAGTAYLLDTARCLHFGSRGNSKERLLLMANFGRANLVDKHNNPILAPVREQLAASLYSDNPVCSFALMAPLL